MKERNIVITGGLSGLGKATALEMVKNGYHVIIFDYADRKAEEVLAELRKEGRADYIHCDLSKKSEIDVAFAQVKERFGHLDCAFNNAGVSLGAGPFETMTEDIINKMVDIDLKAVMFCMINELELMLENGFGRIVNTSSASGLMGSINAGVYNAVKFGVNGLTRSVALDHAKDNITVNAICPGTMATELILNYEKTNPDLFQEWVNMLPGGRLVTPEEVARIVAFLMSDESSVINGAMIAADTGLVAGR